MNKDVPANTIGEFVAYAKANRGKVNYGSSGPGTMLAMEAFKAAAGLDLTHISYKGSSPVTLALVSNEVQVLFDAIVSYRPHVQSGKLKIIGSAGRQRSADFPSVPTMAESGYPDVTGFNGGVWAPAGTPKRISERLKHELNAIARTPQFLERSKQAGAELITGTPEEFGQIIRNEVEFWVRAARTANYKPD